MVLADQEKYFVCAAPARVDLVEAGDVGVAEGAHRDEIEFSVLFFRFAH